MTVPQDPNAISPLSYHAVRPGRTRSLQSSVARGLDFNGVIYLIFALVGGAFCIVDCIRGGAFPWFGLAFSAMYLIPATLLIACGVYVKRGGQTAALTAIVLVSLQLAMLLAILILCLFTGNWAASLAVFFALLIPAVPLIILLHDTVQLFRTWRNPAAP